MFGTILSEFSPTALKVLSVSRHCGAKVGPEQTQAPVPMTMRAQKELQNKENKEPLWAKQSTLPENRGTGGMTTLESHS